jgi:hypothetical protein
MFCKPTRLRKQNNAMHKLVRERLANGTFPIIPEDPGLPVMFLYGPDAIIKLKKQTPDTSQILQTFDECIFMLYQARRE